MSPVDRNPSKQKVKTDKVLQKDYPRDLFHHQSTTGLPNKVHLRKPYDVHSGNGKGPKKKRGVKSLPLTKGGSNCQASKTGRSVHAAILASVMRYEKTYTGVKTFNKCFFAAPSPRKISAPATGFRGVLHSHTGPFDFPAPEVFCPPSRIRVR